MKDKKRKSRLTAEERAESERIGRQLEERIAYHKAKLAEEQRKS